MKIRKENKLRRVMIPQKCKRSLLLTMLESEVSILDEEKRKYKARVLDYPYTQVKTIDRVAGYRVEIRSSREEKHNYAHFHVVKGTDGMASVRIDTLEAKESTLPNNDLKKILEWAQKNKELLKTVWNEFHGYRIYVE